MPIDATTRNNRTVYYVSQENVEAAVGLDPGQALSFRWEGRGFGGNLLIDIDPVVNTNNLPPGFTRRRDREVLATFQAIYDGFLKAFFPDPSLFNTVTAVAGIEDTVPVVIFDLNREGDVPGSFT